MPVPESNGLDEMLLATDGANQPTPALRNLQHGVSFMPDNEPRKKRKAPDPDTYMTYHPYIRGTADRLEQWIADIDNDGIAFEELVNFFNVHWGLDVSIRGEKVDGDEPLLRLLKGLFRPHDSSSDQEEDKNLDEEHFLALVGEDECCIHSLFWKKFGDYQKDKFVEMGKSCDQKMYEAIVETLAHQSSSSGLWASTMSRFTHPVGRKEQMKIKAFDDQLQELEERWRKMTPQLFTKLLHNCSAYENDAVAFLNSFTLQVYRASKETKKPEGSFDLTQFFCKLDSTNDVIVRESVKFKYCWEAGDLTGWASKLRNIFVHEHHHPTPHSSCTNRYLGKLFQSNRRAHTEYRFVYTTACWLVDPNNEQEFAYIIDAFKDMSVDSGVYGTFAARACLLQAWHCIEDLYMIHMAFDFYLVLLFGLVGLDSHNKTHPSFILLVGLAFGVARSVSTLMVELYGVSHQVGVDIFKFYIFKNKTQGILLMVQMFEIVIPLALIMKEGPLLHSCSMAMLDLNATVLSDEDIPAVCQDDFIHTHPVFLAYLVGVKCMLLLQYLLATRFFGEQVIPAYMVIISKKHLAFVSYLMLVVLSAFMAYFMFPIKGGGFDDILWAFLTMYRLTILGDFDLADMEGQEVGDLVLDKYNRTTQGYDGYTADGPYPKQWHHGVTVLFLFLTGIVQLMFLNVYIGLLSELYNGYSEKSLHHFEHFRANLIGRYLLMSRGWRLCWRKALHCVDLGNCLPGMMFGSPYPKAIQSVVPSEDCEELTTDNEHLFSGRARKGLKEVWKGQINRESYIWIAYNPVVFKEEQDQGQTTADDVAAILQTVKALQVKIDDMQHPYSGQPH